MTSHNGGKYIKEQIDSILLQLRECDELVISDDGSIDGSIDLIKSYSDPRIKLYRYKHNIDYSEKYLSAYYFASANFNNALVHAKGDYFIFSDQDDIWMSNKVSKCLEALKTADIVCHNFGIIDGEGNVLEEKYLSDTEYTDLGLLGYWRCFPFRGCCFAFNRKAYNLSVPIPKGTFEHDCWIGMNAVMHGLRYRYIPEPLIHYRRHSINVSELQSPNTLAFKIKYRLRLLTNIIRYWKK